MTSESPITMKKPLRTIVLFIGMVCMLLCATACGAAYQKNMAVERSAPSTGEWEEALPPMEASDSSDDADVSYGYAYEGDGSFVGGQLPAPPMLAQTKPVSPSSAGQAGQTETQEKSSAVVSDAVLIHQVLIYTADIRMAVFEVEKSLAKVEDLAKSLGGFLSRRIDNQITIRIPAAKFDEAIEAIIGMGDVLGREIQVQDVTEEYLDISLRLNNARKVRDRLAELLVDAKNVEESLQVERELSRLSGEIDKMEGRLKYLRNKAQYSTLTISFRPEQVDHVPSTFRLPFPWLRDLGLNHLMDL